LRPNDEVRYWLNEIEDAKKREKDFREDGKTIIELYDGEKPDENPFNILYSNTETLQPALYSNLPRPAVKERFPKKDNKGFTVVNPLNKAVCDASNHMLSYLIDTNIEDFEKFNASIKAVVIDALLPGRGVTAIQFEAETTEDEVKWTAVVANTKKYDRFYHGFATKWERVPWIAYEEYVDEEEAENLFGAEISKKIQFTVSEEDEKNHPDTEERRQTALIYQIWDKNSKTIKWVSNAHDTYLKEDDDPLEVTGFFNTPKPLMLHRKSNNLMPTPLYKLYENQAKELNRLTRSINKVAMAMKVRGGYDGNLGELFERLLDEEDNTLVPVENVTALMDGGFDKHIWLLPLGELAGVLQQLYASREQCKQVIYEITGISDIIRGQSKASETLGAQKVKEAWGTMRLKNMQGDVQEYVRDVLRIMLDVAVKKIPQRLWIKVTGLPYPTEEQKKSALKLINQLKPQIQQLMMRGDQKKLKKLQQEAADLTELLSTPSWENILEVLGDDYIRSFNVDIETNSTLDVEATEDKKNIAEAMNAMAQFMNGLMPMIEKGILPFGAAKSMLLDITKRFRFGPEVEDEINAMTEPKGPDAEQVQEQQKKLAEEKKKLDQEKQKFDEERNKAGKQLDDQANKLEKDNLKFEFKKELFKQQQAMERKLAIEEIKSTDKVLTAEQEADRIKAEAKLKQIVDKHQANVQSIVDRQSANIEKIVGKIEPKQQKEEKEDSQKVVKFTYGKDGKPNGATVESDKETKTVSITYDDNGKPSGAIVNGGI
jgi:hypothetical protein